jgi:hypothetical protein
MAKKKMTADERRRLVAELRELQREIREWLALLESRQGRRTA